EFPLGPWNPGSPPVRVLAPSIDSVPPYFDAPPSRVRAAVYSAPMRSKYVLALAALTTASAFAQTPDPLKPYVSEDARVLVLNHVRVIDGTGAAPAEDQRVDIEAGKITRVQSAKLRNAFP